MKISIILFSKNEVSYKIIDMVLFFWKKVILKKNLQIEFISNDVSFAKNIKIKNEKKILFPIRNIFPLKMNAYIKNASGDIVIITNLNLLQKKTNILNIIRNIKENCIIGKSYFYKKDIFNYLFNNWNKLKNRDLSQILQIPGITYEKSFNLIALKKKHLEDINGIDERFCGGIGYEIDDLINRLKLNKINIIEDNSIVGLMPRIFESNDKKLNKHNLLLMEDNLINKRIVVNED